MARVVIEGIPEDVKQKCKGYCAIKKKTLRAYLLEAMVVAASQFDIENDGKEKWIRIEPVRMKKSIMKM